MSESPANPPSPDGLRSAIEAALASDDTPRRAIEIARRLGVDRGDVNRVLYANPDRFSRNHDAQWSLVDATTDTLAGPDGSTAEARATHRPESRATETAPGKAPAVEEPAKVVRPSPVPPRPGPFGPARDLLPAQSRIEMVAGNTSVKTVIELMSEMDYSQVLVRGPEARAIGVFSWRQFTLRAHALHDLKDAFSKVLAYPVDQFMRPLRPTDFVGPDEYIDTDVDWIGNDFVVVGSPEDPLGILTISDVWGILNDFAEAFVLLHEIELILRSIVWSVAGDLTDEWLARMRTPEGQAPPRTLEDLTLHQFGTLICQKQDRWPRFADHIGGPREVFHTDLMNVVAIRNDVMHFRRKATPTMCGHLTDFRDRLRAVLHRASG